MENLDKKLGWFGKNENKKPLYHTDLEIHNAFPHLDFLLYQ